MPESIAGGSVGPVKLTSLAKKAVPPGQISVVGNDTSAEQRGDSGNAERVVVSITSLTTYLDLPYRRLLDVSHAMPWPAESRRRAVTAAPIGRLEGMHVMPEDPLWRGYLRLSVEPDDTGESLAIDAAGMDREAAS